MVVLGGWVFLMGEVPLYRVDPRDAFAHQAALSGNNRCLSNWATVVCQKEELRDPLVSTHTDQPVFILLSPPLGVL